MTTYKYMEWHEADEMHEQSKKWFSELSFIKDEQCFLNKVIQSFATKSLDKEAFKQLEDFKNAITENQHRIISVYKQVQKHMNQLEILMDGVNQLEMEKAYRKTHKNLFMKVNKCLLEFRNIKERGFGKLTGLLKKHKRMALANPEYKLRTSQT